MEKSKNILLLSEEKVPKALIKLGIPTMIGMMVSSLYNLVDSYFVGTLGTSEQAAVSAVYPISLVMLGIGLLFASGAGCYLSRLLGENRRKEANECAATALYSALLVAAVIIAAMLLFLNPLLSLLGCTDTMLTYAREYAIPFIIGLIFNVFNMTISNIATAEGAAFFGMTAMLGGGISNIILDPICIYALHMGVSGAAIATLLARLVSFSIYIYYLLSKRSNFDFSIKNFRLKKQIYIEIAKIGVPTFVYQFLCSAALSLTDVFAAKYGDAAVAAFGIVNRITTLGVMTMFGFLKGYQPFVGFNYGAKKYERVKSATFYALLWSTVFAAVFCVGMIVFRSNIIFAFNSSDPEVQRIGALALMFNAVTFLTMGVQTVYSFKFMGLGKAMEGGLISLGRQGIFFIPIIIAFSSAFGLVGVILAQPVADLLSFALVVVLGIKNKKEEKMLLTSEMCVLQ